MYQIGDRVVYGIHGVCTVVDREERVIDRKPRTYLVLEPASRDGSRYLIPTHNASAMSKLKPMLSEKEFLQLMESEEVHKDAWIQDENQRKQIYRELIGSGDRVRLMQMVSTLYRHKSALTAAGRKCHLCDDNFLRDAEKLLTSELEAAMDLETDRAKLMLRTKLGMNA